MVRQRRLAWLLISAVSLAVAAPPVILGAEGDPTSVRFHYDWAPTAGDMPILAAEDLGLFDEAGLDVTTTPGGPEINCLQLVAAGQQDICIAPTVGVLTAHPGGVPVVAVGMRQQKSPYGLIVAPIGDHRSGGPQRTPRRRTSLRSPVRDVEGVRDGQRHRR